MTNKVMTIDSRYSGRLMPSRPIGVGRLDRADPVVGGEELQLAGLAVVELGRGVDADHAAWPTAVTTAVPLTSRLVPLRDEQHHQHAGQRQERADAQQPLLVLEYVHEVPLAVDEYEYERTDRC